MVNTIVKTIELQEDVINFLFELDKKKNKFWYNKVNDYNKIQKGYVNIEWIKKTDELNFLISISDEKFIKRYILQKIKTRINELSQSGEVLNGKNNK